MNFLIVGFFVFLSSCIPQHLQKYRNERFSDYAFDGVSKDVEADRNKSSLSAGSTATIIPLGEKTFKFLLPQNEVWDSALNVLLQNYNLNIVQPEAGIISTDWDTFYLNNSVYRNKVTIRISKTSYKTTEVILHNSVEKLQDGTVAGTVGAIWLPDKDSANEIGRIVQNMAVFLNQPQPILPSNLARGGETDLRKKDAN